MKTKNKISILVIFLLILINLNLVCAVDYEAIGYLPPCDCSYEYVDIDNGLSAEQAYLQEYIELNNLNTYYNSYENYFNPDLPYHEELFSTVDDAQMIFGY